MIGAWTMGEARQRKLQAAKESASTGPKPWPLSNPDIQRDLEAWFTRIGVDPTRPGIHDTPEFLHAEARYPDALNKVAHLVEARTYTEVELAQAERKILVAAEAVARRVAQDGRPGLCVVASGVLSRMLDELEVWNYTAKSNLTVTFPSEISRSPRYFYSVDSGDFAAAHAVVVAPPFVVIDVTVRQQSYETAAMGQYLPAIASTKDYKPYQVTADQLISPEFRENLQMRRLSPDAYLTQRKPEMLELMRHLPSRQVSLENGSLGYGIVAVTGYQERLSEMQGEFISIDGLTPQQIFEQDVLPRL
ncbi:hypothetical protein KAM429_39080 [Aquipseudomonas alcaligenes]|uniref:Uncharacterized protein n=2 Tax=Aquipseudomonas alcaligenes TaxID=43263 RepID=A0AA37CI36_AQUAC|nr:hypothetical protein KAM428_38480 [Pseudomonas alcaligenes]GIZ73147.1 hypothetical protein KAM429_39080 [Pseudomonas alcaligenes]GIZ86208.1 hypothetical protein KAM434_39030 [Pseudomonas alcaligenes]GIZ90548.1 hypothetical protein KAM435_38750 [Pseudomonas alcaligenes]GIZ94919.1 hypothetical protein KAM436_38870 [Pseudomonas alcaligenes]